MSDNTKKPEVKILLVDDDEAWCKSISEYLEDKLPEDYKRYTYKLYSEDKAVNAVSKIKEIEPHVVVLDHHFDGQAEGGLETYNKIGDVFKNRLSDHKLALIYYSKNTVLKSVSELEQETLKIKHEKEIPSPSLIRLRHEYGEPLMLKMDEYGDTVMLKDDIDQLLDSMKLESRHFGQCDNCGLVINIYSDSILLRTDGKDEPFKENTTLKILCYLATRPGEWFTFSDIEKHCWKGGYVGEDSGRVKRHFNRIKNDELLSLYIDSSEKQAKLNIDIPCHCKGIG